MSVFCSSLADNDLDYDLGWANLFHKGPGSKYFKLCKLYKSLSQSLNSTIRKQREQNANEWGWLCSIKALFIEKVVGQSWPQGHDLLTPNLD